MSDIVLWSWCPHSLPNEWPLLLPSHTSLHPWHLLVTHLLHHNFSGIFNPFNLLNMFANLSIYVPFQCHHCTSSSHHHYLPLEYHNCLLTFKSASPFALVSRFPPSSKVILLESDLEHSLLCIKTSMVYWWKNKNYGKAYLTVSSDLPSSHTLPHSTCCLHPCAGDLSFFLAFWIRWLPLLRRHRPTLCSCSFSVILQ